MFLHNNNEQFSQYAKYMGFGHTTDTNTYHTHHGLMVQQKTDRNVVCRKVELASRTSQVPKSVSRHATSDDKKIASSASLQWQNLQNKTSNADQQICPSLRPRGSTNRLQKQVYECMKINADLKKATSNQ